MKDDLGKLNVNIDPDEVKKLVKEYKKLKKYMRSPLYEIREMDGKEKIIKDLLSDYDEQNQNGPFNQNMPDNFSGKFFDF